MTKLSTIRKFLIENPDKSFKMPVGFEGGFEARNTYGIDEVKNIGIDITINLFDGSKFRIFGSEPGDNKPKYTNFITSANQALEVARDFGKLYRFIDFDADEPIEPTNIELDVITINGQKYRKVSE